MHIALQKNTEVTLDTGDAGDAGDLCMDSGQLRPSRAGCWLQGGHLPTLRRSRHQQVPHLHVHLCRPLCALLRHGRALVDRPTPPALPLPHWLQSEILRRAAGRSRLLLHRQVHQVVHQFSPSEEDEDLAQGSRWQQAAVQHQKQPWQWGGRSAPQPEHGSAHH